MTTATRAKTRRRELVAAGPAAPLAVAVPIERAASPWLHHDGGPSALASQADALDSATRALVAQAGGGISPVSLAAAWTDWAAHLALAPGRRMALAQDALQKALLGTLYASHAMRRDGQQWVEPLPQDRRFADPAWREWPFNTVHQSFLLAQAWWQEATRGVPGVSAHHEDMTSFGARQWLDRFSPSNMLCFNPVVLRETLRRGGANLVEGWLNWLDDLERQTSAAPPRGAEAFQVGRDVAATPGKVVLRNRLLELIQYAPAGARVHTEPVLVIPAWINKYYILDLSPHNSLLRHLVQAGHTVFAISWKNPGVDDRDLGFDDYRTLGVMAALEAIGRIRPRARVHALGYCLGGTLLAMTAAAMARQRDERLATLTLLAAQTDFEEPGELGLFIDDSQVQFVQDMMQARGFLGGRQMAGAFQLLRSEDLIWSYRVQHYLLGQCPPMTDLMAWNADRTRLPSKMHAQYLRQLYLHNDLAEGRLRVDGRPVALTDIRAPIFAVGTLLDHVAPWRSVFKIQLLTDTDVTFLLTSGGHNAGIVSEPGHPGRRFQVLERRAEQPYLDPDQWLLAAPAHHGSWWPTWQAWLAAHSSGRVAAPLPGATPGLPALDDAPGRYVHEA